MANWLRACSVDEVPPGGSREVAVGGRVIALFNVGGDIYALDGVCPHAGGPLGEGRLEGSIVTCPWHGWQFDVCTGRHCLNPNLVQPSYRTRIDGDEILVELPELP